MPDSVCTPPPPHTHLCLTVYWLGSPQVKGLGPLFPLFRTKIESLFISSTSVYLFGIPLKKMYQKLDFRQRWNILLVVHSRANVFVIYFVYWNISIVKINLYPYAGKLWQICTETSLYLYIIVLEKWDGYTLYMLPSTVL